MKVLLFLLCLLFTTLVIESYSDETTIIDRTDIDTLKKKIITTHDKIISLEVDIVKQKTIISENEMEYENLKLELKTMKKNSNDSWDDLKKMMDAKKELEKSDQKIKDSKEKLRLLGIEKSDNIKLIDTLDVEIENLVISDRKSVG
mgnify:CR=1 FL=1